MHLYLNVNAALTGNENYVKFDIEEWAPTSLLDHFSFFSFHLNYHPEKNSFNCVQLEVNFGRPSPFVVWQQAMEQWSGILVFGRQWVVRSKIEHCTSASQYNKACPVWLTAHPLWFFFLDPPQPWDSGRYIKQGRSVTNHTITTSESSTVWADIGWEVLAGLPNCY